MKHYFTPENALKVTYDKVSLEFQICPTVKPPAGPLTIRGGRRIMVGEKAPSSYRNLGGIDAPAFLAIVIYLHCVNYIFKTARAKSTFVVQSVTVNNFTFLYWHVCRGVGYFHRPTDGLMARRLCQFLASH